MQKKKKKKKNYNIGNNHNDDARSCWKYVSAMSFSFPENVKNHMRRKLQNLLLYRRFKNN